MAEHQHLARAAAGRRIHHRARHGGRGGDGDRGRAHHRVVQLAHGHRARQQVDVGGLHRLAAGRHVVPRRCDEGDLRRQRALRRGRDIGDQPHAHRAVRADRLELLQRGLVFVDRTLKFGAVVAQRGRFDEHHRHARIDHRRPEHADTRHVEVIDGVAGGEHRATAFAIALVRGIDELELHFRRRERHAVQFEVARFLHLAIRHLHMRHDGLLDVGLPDPHGAQAVARHACRVDHSVRDGEGPDRRRQVAAVAAPVDEGAFDRDLSVQVIHVMPGLRARRNDHHLAGARRGPAHAVGVLAVRIGRADHAAQQCVPRRSRHLRPFGQVLQAEEHAFRRAAAHVGGGDADLGDVGHVNPR